MVIYCTVYEIGEEVERQIFVAFQSLDGDDLLSDRGMVVMHNLDKSRFRDKEEPVSIMLNAFLNSDEEGTAKIFKLCSYAPPHNTLKTFNTYS